MVNQGRNSKIAEANNSLAKLHNIDDLMNSNLIAPGKPEAALLSAGSGTNLRNANALKSLGEMTGKDMKGDAEKLAAMKFFTNPSLTPVDTTGKAAGRMGLGGLAGAGLGHMTGIPGAEIIGATAGASTASPAAMKSIINAGQKVWQTIGAGVKSIVKGAIQEPNRQPNKRRSF